MAIEKSKQAVEITPENVKTILVDNKNLDDFNSQGNPKPNFEVGKEYTLKTVVGLPLSGQKNSNGTQKLYPAFEVYKGKSFQGYMSITAIQARKFVDVRMSRANKPYAKFDVQNRFNAPENITYGVESLLKLVGKKIKCEKIDDTHKQPKFGIDLEIGMTESDSDVFEAMPLIYLSLVG